MVLKYADGLDPFRGEVLGGVYQKYASGQQMTSTKKNDRYPYALQWQRAHTLIGLTRYWRMLTAAQQTAWNDFAIAFPQPTQVNPLRYLNGYNLFCRWNFFNRLVNGQSADILLTPAMSVVADSVLTPTVTNNAGQLILDASWSRSGQDIWAAVYMSRVVSAGVNYIASEPRMITGIDNGGGITPNFGLLYTKYVGMDSKLPSSTGWRLPVNADFESLRTFGGGVTVAGQKLKEGNLLYWTNTNGTNELLFNSRGIGERRAAGDFASFKFYHQMWSATDPSGSSTVEFWYTYVGGNNFTLATGGTQWWRGYSIRLCRDVLGIADYTVRTYVGNSGIVYRTVVLNNIEWMADNLCDTVLNDGTPIPEITDPLLWAANRSNAFCAYNNDMSLAFSASPSSFNITNQYFEMFGQLPNTGDKILMKVIKFNKISGQFLPEQTFFLTVL